MVKPDNILLKILKVVNSNSSAVYFVIIVSRGLYQLVTNWKIHAGLEEKNEKIAKVDFKIDKISEDDFSFLLHSESSPNPSVEAEIIEKVKSTEDVAGLFFYFTFVGHTYTGNQSGDLTVGNILKMLSNQGIESIPKLVYVSASRGYFYNNDNALATFAEEYRILKQAYLEVKEMVVIFACQFGCVLKDSPLAFKDNDNCPATSFIRLLEHQIELFDKSLIDYQFIIDDFLNLQRICDNQLQSDDISFEIFMTKELHLQYGANLMKDFLEFGKSCDRKMEDILQWGKKQRLTNDSLIKDFEGVVKISKETPKDKFLICIVDDYCEDSPIPQHRSYEESCNKLNHSFNKKLFMENLSNESDSKLSMKDKIKKGFDEVKKEVGNTNVCALYLESHGRFQYIKDGKNELKITELLDDFMKDEDLKSVVKVFLVNSCRNFYNASNNSVWKQVKTFVDTNFHISTTCSNCFFVYSSSIGCSAYWPARVKASSNSTNDNLFCGFEVSPFLTAVCKANEAVDVTDRTKLFEYFEKLRDEQRNITTGKYLGTQYASYQCTFDIKFENNPMELFVKAIEMKDNGNVHEDQLVEECTHTIEMKDNGDGHVAQQVEE